jgi:hypothetical protein
MSDMEVIVHLTDGYESALNNAAQWRKDIGRLLQSQKDKRFVKIIKERVTKATEKFQRSLKQE